MRIDQEDFRTRLRRLPETAVSGMPQELRLYPSSGEHDDAGISVMYAPLESMNIRAKVIFVGITPGKSQMRRSWTAARRAMSEGVDLEAALSEVKRVSAFNDEKGHMRRNLFRMVRDWRIDELLGLAKPEDLFETGWNKIHTTSVVRYPTFRWGENYEGTPSALRHSALSSVAREHLVKDLKALPHALVFPLGVKPTKAVSQIVREERLACTVFPGLMHPSPQCSSRIAWLCGPRTTPIPDSRLDFRGYDQARNAFWKRAFS
jgi:hypothetical protein